MEKLDLCVDAVVIQTVVKYLFGGDIPLSSLSSESAPGHVLVKLPSS